ncbi:MAG: sulfatase, partial [bacterium]
SALTGRFVFYGLVAVALALLFALAFNLRKRTRKRPATPPSTRGRALIATATVAVWANLFFLFLYLLYEKTYLPTWNKAAYVAASVLIPALITAAVVTAFSQLYAKYKAVRGAVFFASYILLVAAVTGAPSSFFYLWHKSWARPTPSDLPDVVVITLDAWRADAFNEKLTPTLYDFARRDGLVFTNARAPSSWTLPSFSAALTGSYNVANVEGLRSGGPSRRSWDVVPQTWAEVMRDNGYDTYAVLSNPHLDTVRLIFRGFSHFDYVDFRPTLTPIRFYDTALYFALRGRRCSPEVPGETTRRLVDKTLKILRRPTKRPTFVWVHILDPHFPYQPLRRVLKEEAPYLLNKTHYGVDRKYLTEANSPIAKGLYEGEVRSTDSLVAPLLAELERRKNTLVVISADHGEEFFEHGGKEHSHTLYDEVCRVPLIVALPGARGHRPRVGVVPAPVSLVDVAPSVLNYLALPVPPTMEGRQDLLTGNPPADRAVYLTLNRAANMLAALVERDKKVIAKIKGEYTEIKYFDLKADPAEQRPLPLDDDGERLKEKLLKWVEDRDVSREIGVGDTSLFGERADLRALGYM